MPDKPKSAAPGPDSPAFSDLPVDTGFATRTIRGGMATAGAQGSKIILNAAGLMILARLLRPEDFGLVAMVAPVLELIVIFQDFGLSTATVQRPMMTHAQSTNLFWFNVVVSSVLGLLVAALAPAIAAFYGDPRLMAIAIAFGGMVVCSGLAAQHLALLTRQMQFARLARQDVAALAIGLTVGVVAAWQGLGYWALILSVASRSIALLVLVWVSAQWWPGRPSRGSGVASMVRFGRDLTLVRFGTFLTENLDSVLVGKVWGGYALGLYDRAYSLLKLYKQVNGPVNAIATSVLSKLQHDPRRYRHYYVKGLGLVTGLSMPFMAFLTANASDVVRVALGDKWLPAVPIFLALAPAAFIGTINPATWWLYASLGRSERQLRWAMFVQVPLTVGAYFAGLPFGPFGVAVAFSIVTVALRLPSILYCLRDFQAYLKLRDVLSAILPAAFSSIAAACVATTMKTLLALPLHPLAAVMLDAALFGLSYLVLYCVMPIGRENVRTFGQIIRRAVAR